ncbi:MAG TPA: hypothetical protein VFQ06_03835, partial [Nitrospira sp.]|nr:hypothetical protein [Nitrospira sp.]
MRIGAFCFSEPTRAPPQGRRIMRGPLSLSGSMRFLRWFFGVLLLLLIAAVAGLLWYRQSSLPTHEGTLRVSGIGATAHIARDASGIPTLTAASEADALFALGV